MRSSFGSSLFNALVLPFLLILTLISIYFIYRANPYLMAQESLFEQMLKKKSNKPIQISFDIPHEDSTQLSAITDFNLQRTRQTSDMLRPTHRWTLHQEWPLYDISDPISMAPTEQSQTLIDAEGVYRLEPHEFMAFNLNGDLLWSFRAPDKDSFITGPLTTLKGLVVLSTQNGILFGLDKLSGKIFWYTKSNYSFLRPPALGKKHAYLFVDEKKDGQWSMSLVDLRNGKLSQSTRRLEGPLVGEIVLNEEETIFYYGTPSGRLYAFNLQRNNLIWSTENEFGFNSSPALSGDRLFVINNKGGLSSHDTRNGRVVWSSSTESQREGHLALFIEGFRVYVKETSGVIYAFNSRTGKRDWKLSTQSSSPIFFLTRLRGSSFAELRVEPRLRFWTLWSLCSQNELCIYDSREGQLYARINLKDDILGSPYIHAEGDEMWLVSKDKQGLRVSHFIDPRKSPQTP